MTNSNDGKLFLDRLPAALERTQMANLEAIKLSCSLIQLDWSDIHRTILGLIPREPSDVTELERLTLIRCAWSIVDRIDMLRQIFHSQRKHFDIRGELQHWDEVSSAASSCRNFMDHLPGKLNSTAKKRSGYPAYGFITFNWYPAEDLEETFGEAGSRTFKLHARNVRIIQASSTYKHFELQMNDMVDDLIWNRFGNVNLFAADTRVSLSRAHEIAVQVPALISAPLEAAWQQIVLDQIATGEADLKELYKTVDHPIAFNVRGEFDEPAIINV